MRRRRASVARSCLGLGAIFGTEFRHLLVQLRVALAGGLGDHVPFACPRSCPLARPCRSPAPKRAGSARSGCFAWPPCAAARRPPAWFFGVPVPLNSAMAYSTSASTLSASDAACSSRTAVSMFFGDAGALLVEGRQRVLRLGVAGVGGDAQQFRGAPQVLRQHLAVEIEQREIIGRLGLAELCGGGQQFYGVLAIDRTAAAGEPHHAEREHRPRGRRLRRRACTIPPPWRSRA